MMTESQYMMFNAHMPKLSSLLGRCLMALTVSLLSANHAVAESCYVASPYLSSQGDAYYDLDTPMQLSAADQAKLATFFEQLTGEWHGDLTSSHCKGPDRAPRQAIKTASLNVKAAQRPEQTLQLAAQKQFLNSRIRKVERLTLMPNTNFYGITINDNQLIFSERYRRNVNQTSRLAEVIYRIESRKNGLSIHRNYYTNGVFTGAEAWDLSR